MKEEGLSVGMSSGINVAGAMRLAAELPQGSTIVTILCDYASKYKLKMSPAFLKEKGLPVPDWLPESADDPGLSEDVLAASKRARVEEE